MSWKVLTSYATKKTLAKLPVDIQARFSFLAKELVEYGPIRGNWPNYSKLTGNRHHCHIKKGKPCYVVVWEVTDQAIKLIEVQYAGTHQKAPY